MWYARALAWRGPAFPARCRTGDCRAASGQCQSVDGLSLSGLGNVTGKVHIHEVLVIRKRTDRPVCMKKDAAHV